MQNESKFIILSIVKSFLGEPKNSKNAESKEQWEFNCISETCKHDDGKKYNLAFNSINNVWKCWKCGERGYISSLVKKYGSKEDYVKLKLVLPSIKSFDFVGIKNKAVNKPILCDLPVGYSPLSKYVGTNKYKLALDYITKERRVSLNLIDKLQIGYTELGKSKGRIIIPSLNSDGLLNYFEARSFIKGVKPTYLKPDSPDKNDIIFNELNINWDLPIYLVEGAFDMLRIPNSIPMLGKIPSWVLISKLIEHNCTVVVCVDEDALGKGLDIYSDLNSLGLNVYFVDLTGKGDVSKCYEDGGNDAIIKLLSSRIKVDFEYLMRKTLIK